MKPSARDYAQALYDLTDKDGHVDVTILKRFLDKLVRDDNHDLLPVIIEEFGQIANELRGAMAVTVTTAHALSEPQRQAIAEAFKETHPNQSIELIEKVEPAIIGGVVLQVGDTMIDHSVKGKLDALIERLS